MNHQPTPTPATHDRVLAFTPAQLVLIVGGLLLLWLWRRRRAGRGRNTAATG